MNLKGHYWTLRPRIREMMGCGPKAPEASAWTHQVKATDGRSCTLSGALREPDEAWGMAVLVHGLGGSLESGYMQAGAVTMERLGLACLRLNLRGADLSGDGFYHAGLTSDLEAVIDSPAVRRHKQVYLLGYSLGGHLVLRYLGEDSRPRVSGAISVCAPLELSVAARHLDTPRLMVYRRHVMSGLQAMYAAYRRRHEGPVTVEQARRIKTIEEWDEQVVAPHHGFESAQDYWRRNSAANLIGDIRTPCVGIWGALDPMIPAHLVRPYIPRNPRLSTEWIRDGGHVGFPTAGSVSAEELGMQALLKGVGATA